MYIRNCLVFSIRIEKLFLVYIFFLIIYKCFHPWLFELLEEHAMYEVEKAALFPQLFIQL